MPTVNPVPGPGHWPACGPSGAGVGLTFPEPHEVGGLPGYLNKIADLQGKGMGLGAWWPPVMAAPERSYVGLGAIDCHINQGLAALVWQICGELDSNLSCFVWYVLLKQL